MCAQGSEELFSTEPLPARTPSVESVTHVGGSGPAETGATGGLMTRPRTPISTALQRVSVERLDEDLVSGEPEVSHCCHINDGSVGIRLSSLIMKSFVLKWHSLSIKEFYFM